ncbi:MAG: TIGR02206 family membrane protein [Betaproteobacteria bacterium]|nr:TIGR02206 family membrane protein [Betaproteobacteria bacterium]
MTEAFRPFTLTHAAVLVAIAAAAWLWVAAVRKQPEVASPTMLDYRLAVANLVVWIMAHTWWNLPPRFDPAVTLPLQLCHLTSLVASAALLTRGRLWRALLYFWGIGLSTQALLTPTLTDPPTVIWFWAFWGLHGFVLAAAVHDLVANRFRPTWRDYGAACAASAVYLAVVFPLNLAIGANYGFVGQSKPQTPSVIDLLGPWPGRVVVIVALVAGLMALLMLPWHFVRQRRVAGNE